MAVTDETPRFGLCLPCGRRGDLPDTSPAGQWAFIQDYALHAQSLGFDALWKSAATYFAGQHSPVDGALLAPPPVQGPHPRLWIGGQGVRRTLPLAAERADWWNIAGSPENVALKRAVVHEHCAKIGRDPS